LASENIGQGYRRFAYLKNLSNVVNNQVNNIKGTQADLESEKKELNILKSSAKQMRGEQQKEYDKLRKEEDRSNQVAKTLSNNQTKYKQDLAQKKREVERLNKEIERILNKSIQTQNKNKTDVDYTLTGMFEQNKGKLPWPVKQGVITDKFGVHFDPVYKNLKLPENNGINISTSKNADACCVFDGVVKQVVFIQGYSSCVLVQHGTFYTFYCKLKKASVKAGQRVSTGESLGTIDESNGVSIIHFEIWKGMEKQNPETWLRP
ncbi:MAG: peptidoglycan DD-metalloendopeptidase family protein, partial [Saccharofermentanales bacterium]